MSKINKLNTLAETKFLSLYNAEYSNKGGNTKNWTIASRKEKKNLEEVYLNKEDKDILGDFLKSLGYSGVYGQEKIFNLALENLKINIKEAGEESKKNTKLYRYLGMCFGAMISIFLL